MDVVALGEILIDFVSEREDENGYPTLKANPGGAPGNYLAAAAAYGCQTAMIGKVGTDVFGNKLLATLQSRGIDCRGLKQDSGVFTTLAFVTLDKQGDRSFSFSRKPGADTCLRKDEIPWELIENTKVFHFGTLSLTDEPSASATQEAVAFAKAHGKLISFDPNYRAPLWTSEAAARKAMEWGIHAADVVKISEEEVEFLWGLSPEEGAAKILQTESCGLVLVTLGAKGCYYATHCLQGMVEALPVKPVDTTGAGDIFGGAFISQLLRIGKSLDRITQVELQEMVGFSCTAASLSTLRQGGISSVVPLDTVLERRPVF